MHTADAVALARLLPSLQIQADLESLTILLKLPAQCYVELDEDGADEQEVDHYHPDHTRPFEPALESTIKLFVSQWKALSELLEKSRSLRQALCLPTC